MEAIKKVFRGATVDIFEGKEWVELLDKYLGSPAANFNFVGRDATFEEAQGKFKEVDRLDKEGASDQDIFERTGWYKDRHDGKWKYELPETGVSFRLPENLNGEYALSDILKHPTLYEAYPDFANIRVAFEELKDDYGQYDPNTNTIKLDRNAEEHILQSVTRHEIQHAIQAREGFARGANMAKGRERVSTEISRMGDEANRRRRHAAATPPNRDEASLNNERAAYLENRIKEFKDNFEAYADYFYKAYAGEIEARNIEKRLKNQGLRVQSPNATAEKFGSFETVQFLTKPNGTVYGIQDGNNIYLNGDHLNLNTPIHEAGHIFTNWAKDNAKELYASGVALLRRANASNF